MIIVEDTRNQIGKHKQLNKDLKDLGYEVIRSKLYVGDYALLTDQSICIDTKKDWLEIAGNICGKQHKRFKEECLRAKKAGIKLIVLIEEGCPLCNWECTVNKQGKKLSQVNKDTLHKAMQTITEKYGVQFIFSAKEKSAETILMFLGVI